MCDDEDDDRAERFASAQGHVRLAINAGTGALLVLSSATSRGGAGVVTPPPDLKPLRVLRGLPCRAAARWR